MTSKQNTGYNSYRSAQDCLISRQTKQRFSPGEEALPHPLQNNAMSADVLVITAGCYSWHLAVRGQRS